MEKLDLNKKNYDELLPKSMKKRKKPVLFNVILAIVVVVLICVFIFLFKRYNNREALDLFESKINITISLAREIVNDEAYTEDYVLIEFPDTAGIITNEGYMLFNDKEVAELDKGYIVIYKDDSLSFKLSDGTYCASKSYDDASYKLYIFGECLNYDINYKED